MLIRINREWGEQGMSTSGSGQWISAEEAAERLGVKRETVYAYISRGRLVSRRTDDGRGRVLSLADVETLASRSRGGSRRAQSPEIIESAITLIEGDGVHYRGHPVAELASSSTFEQVADLLWGVPATSHGQWGAVPAVVEQFRAVAAVLPESTLPVDMLRIAGACMAAYDPPEPGASPEMFVTTAKRFVATILTALPDLSGGTGPSGTIAGLLWSRLCGRQPTEAELSMLDGALIVLADHDLARSTLAIRTAARAGFDAGGLIRLGMDSGGGPVKGVASLAIESFLQNLSSADTVELALTRRLKQGEPVPGFGHPMYGGHDPRADLMLDRLRTAAVDRDRLRAIEEVIRTQTGRGLPPPNAGFALAAMTYVTGMVPGSGETIFVVARTAGWIAHAIEAVGLGPLERANASYVGPVPQTHEEEVG